MSNSPLLSIEVVLFFSTSWLPSLSGGCLRHNQPGKMYAKILPGGSFNNLLKPKRKISTACFLESMVMLFNCSPWITDPFSDRKGVALHGWHLLEVIRPESPTFYPMALHN
jgi:hypothetical protein